VSSIQSQLKVIEIAGKALAEGGDSRFGQILAWLAYARETAPGYLSTWAPDEIDLIAGLGDYGLGETIGTTNPGGRTSPTGPRARRFLGRRVYRGVLVTWVLGARSLF